MKLFDGKCVICDDKAIGYNFNVLTCSSCKAFFRRNALKDGNALKCPFSGNCDLTYLTRKFCQKCRLNKCFALGMKKDLILPERELQLRKERRIRKKLDLKLNKNNDQKSCNSSSDETQDISGSDCDILDQFLFNNTISDEDIEAQVMDIETCLTSTAAKVCESVTPIVSINRPITDYNNNFNAIEGNRLTELLSASNSLKISYGSVVSVADTYIDAMSALCCNVEEMVIKSIEMSKNISLFSELCVNDQISLMKYGSIQVTYLRNITGFDPNTNQLTVPDEDPSQSVLVDLNAIKCTKLYVFEACVKYFQQFASEWDCDHIIIDLMTAIILFDPSRPNLQHRKLVKFNQCVYMYLLKRYLQLRYRSDCDSLTKFSRLMKTIKYLNFLYNKQMQQVAEHKAIEVVDCGELLNELYS